MPRHHPRGSELTALLRKLKEHHPVGLQRGHCRAPFCLCTRMLAKTAHYTRVVLQSREDRFRQVGAFNAAGILHCRCEKVPPVLEHQQTGGPLSERLFNLRLAVDRLLGAQRQSGVRLNYSRCSSGRPTRVIRHPDALCSAKKQGMSMLRQRRVLSEMAGGTLEGLFGLERRPLASLQPMTGRAGDWFQLRRPRLRPPPSVR